MTARIWTRAPQTRRSFMTGLVALPLADCASMEPKKTPMKFLVQADQSINPDEHGDPYPVVIRIYELKQTTLFNQLAFFDLMDADANKLGPDLVAKREIEIKPGETQTFDRDTPVETRYVGVIAGFRHIENAQWRVDGEVKPERGNQIVIKLTAYSVNLKATADKTLGLF
jgi:type VI secretion system protein VasD